MNDTWGFAKNDENWKSTSDLVRKLIDIASKGGNFLLNVGPDAQGNIPPESVERLRGVGEWMKVNGESIYGTTASPFDKLTFKGACTSKGDIIYVHVFEWPDEGVKLTLANAPVSVKLVGPGDFSIVWSGSELEIHKPSEVDPIATVIAIRMK